MSCAVVLLFLLTAGTPRADIPSMAHPPSPGLQCRQAIALAERGSQLPPHLLAAIAHVESGRRDPQTGMVSPWPWSINVEGVDHIYETEPEVIAAVRTFQATGHRSIDVGCMQVNIMYHPDAFATLEQAFDPQTNAAYAARFLAQLRQQTGSWDKATAWYHSATPELGDEYLRKVSAALPGEAKIGTDVPSQVLSPGLPSPAASGAAGPPGHFARILPMPGMGGSFMTGRTLDSYRNMPVLLASRR